MKTTKEHNKFLIYFISIVDMKTKVTKMCTYYTFEIQLKKMTKFIHKSCSKCLPFTVTHDLHLLSNERWTRATILGLSDMSPAATTILAIKDCSDSTGVSYTRLFMCPHKKKSRGVKSGDLGG